MIKKIISILLVMVIMAAAMPTAGFDTLAAADGTGYYRVQTTEGNLRIRKSASTGSEQLGSIPSGVTVSVTEVSGDWGKVTYKGITGWINLDYAVKTAAPSSDPTEEVTTPAQIRARLDELRQKFPKGKYWNHYGSSKKNPDGWTNTPCPSGHYLNGVQQCNGQCDGFAKKLGLDLFGVSTSGWETTKYSIDTVCVGDIIRYNGKHTIMVVGFTKNTNELIIADCNWDYHCVIRWDALFKTSRYFSYVNWVLHYPGNYYTRDVYLGNSPESAEFDQSEVIINEGGKLALSVTTTPRCPNATRTWTTSNKKVAVVNSSGTVTAVGPGTATITCRADNAVASCTVTVTPKKDIQRISGTSRYDTANAIASAGWSAGAQNVILASGVNFADALAGVPLAKALDAPILLTGGVTLEEKVLAQIESLGAENIYILGGKAAVSDEIEQALRSAGYTTERLAGYSRFETSVIIAEKLLELGSEPSEIFITNGYSFADALSVGSVAAAGASPILYVTTTGELDSSVVRFLSDSDVKNAVILGGESAVSASVAQAVSAQLGATAARLYGTSRYDTCLAILKKYASRLSGDSLALATGQNFPDALAGGALAAKLGIALLLTAPTASADASAWVSALSPDRLYIFGGTGAVSDKQVYEYTV